MLALSSPPNRRSRFKRIDLAGEARRNEELAHELNGEVYNLFKEGVEPFEFKEAKYYFRFLPQPEGAQNNWSMTLPYIYVDLPGHRGYLPLTIPQAQLFDNMRRALYAHPELGKLMAGEANRNGVSIGAKYKSIFMGFCYNDPEPKVLPIVLPSNGFIKPKGRARIHAGTVINNFMFDLDSSGAVKYGDIVDIDTGSLVGIEVTGIKDRREYVPTVDRKFPIDATLEPLLDQVVKFEDIVEYRPNSDIYTVARLKLTPAMWEYVVAKLQLPVSVGPTVVRSETERTSTAPATIGQPAVATSKTAEAPLKPAPLRLAASDVAPPRAGAAVIAAPVPALIAEAVAPKAKTPAVSAEATLDHMSDDEIRTALLKRGIPVA